MTKKSGKVNNTCFYSLVSLHDAQAEDLIRRQHEVVRVNTEALITTATKMKLCLAFLCVPSFLSLLQYNVKTETF